MEQAGRGYRDSQRGCDKRFGCGNLEPAGAAGNQERYHNGCAYEYVRDGAAVRAAEYVAVR